MIESTKLKIIGEFMQMSKRTIKLNDIVYFFIYAQLKLSIEVCKPQLQNIFICETE